MCLGPSRSERRGNDMTDIEQAARAEAERRWLSSRRQRDFVAGASWLAEYLLSDEAVERGLKASREFPMKRGLDN